MKNISFKGNKWILQLMKNWRYDKRILVPFDFDFKLVLQKIREEKKNGREVEKERAKNRKRKREQRARNALLPKFEMVKVNSTLLVPFGMANMESSNYINGSVVGVNKQGRVIKRLGHLFQMMFLIHQPHNFFTVMGQQ